MRPLRGGQGTFDRIIENIRRVAGRVPHRHRRQLRRELGRQLPGAARVPRASRSSPTSWSRSIQADRPRPDAGAGGRHEGHAAADAGRRRRHAVKPLGGTCMTSAGAGGGVGAATRATSLDDKMTFLREETRRHGFPTPRRRAQRPVPRAHAARAHDRPGRVALCVPRASPARRRMSTGHIDDRHEPWRETARETVRPAQSLEGVRRLRLHPGVCRGMRGGIAHDSLAT